MDAISPKLSRREWLKAAATAAVATQVSTPAVAQEAAIPATPARTKYTFFNAAEAAFIEAAVARLIPSDALGPGAIEAGVPQYLDKQLGGAWGNGERLYRSGPWKPGEPSQGYQLPFAPAELYRNALRALLAEGGDPFDKRSPDAQDAYLTQLQHSERDLGGVPANIFFDSLLSMTIEGYFSDPVYGGNRDMAAWRMIGFPGAYAEYYHLVDQHGIAFTRAPMSLGENARGQIHLDPNIPAHLGTTKSGKGKS
jgi:gluconate 2-dehydrogenase gamma chain